MDSEAFKFMGSLRGQYIMAEVMTRGIAAMESVPDNQREVSNIADAQYILDGVFPLGKEMVRGITIAGVDMVPEHIRASFDRRRNQ